MVPVLFVCFAAASAVFGLLLYIAAGLGVIAALLYALLFFVLLHLLCLLLFWAASLSTPTDRPLEKQNPFSRIGIGLMAPLVTFYAGVRPVVNGAEKLPTDSRFLYVSNHRSLFDPLVVMGYQREWNISFISKPSNTKIPLGWRIVYAAGYLSIDRENDRNALRTILTAADYLKRDLCSIGIYPEGTRSKTDELLPFHAGSLKIAQRAKVPIVVAAVHGTEGFRHFRLFHRVPVTLNILEVIPAETVCALRTQELSDRIRATVQADLDRDRPGKPASAAADGQTGTGETL